MANESLAVVTGIAESMTSSVKVSGVKWSDDGLYITLEFPKNALDVMYWCAATNLLQKQVMVELAIENEAPQ